MLEKKLVGIQKIEYVDRSLPWLKFFNFSNDMIRLSIKITLNLVCLEIERYLIVELKKKSRKQDKRISSLEKYKHRLIKFLEVYI